MVKSFEEHCAAAAARISKKIDPEAGKPMAMSIINADGFVERDEEPTVVAILTPPLGRRFLEWVESLSPTRHEIDTVPASSEGSDS